MYKNNEKIAEHKRRNREMFDAIAQRYDVLNHLLSGGIDIYWRRRALNSLQLSRRTAHSRSGNWHSRFRAGSGAFKSQTYYRRGRRA